jgi:hypothetical protein
MQTLADLEGELERMLAQVRNGIRTCRARNSSHRAREASACLGNV